MKEFEQFTAQYCQSDDADGQHVCSLVCSTRIYVHKIYASKVHFAKLVLKQHSYFVTDFIFFTNIL